MKLCGKNTGLNGLNSNPNYGGCENFRISRNFFEIFNFVFREHFPRISRNFAKHEIETWAKISQFGETRNHNVGYILAILQERDEFFIKQM